jgi:hypothetical protein
MHCIVWSRYLGVPSATRQRTTYKLYMKTSLTNKNKFLEYPVIIDHNPIYSFKASLVLTNERTLFCCRTFFYSIMKETSIGCW